MEKRLGKKVYRKMPTMQVMTGCLCYRWYIISDL